MSHKYINRVNVIGKHDLVCICKLRTVINNC
jgi:hypothetical protein